jgi:FkbM family methyltransferase
MKLELSQEKRDHIMARSAAYEKARPKITLTGGGRPVVMDTSNRLCAWRVLSYFDKEPETIQWIEGMGEGDVLFDIGANIGLYTVWAAVTRPVTVYAFEPEANNFAILNENLRANGLTNRVQAFCAGISDISGLGPMEIHDGAAGQSGHQVQVVRGPKFKSSKNKHVQGIMTVTLDHLVYTAALPCPTHIKIDVDGIEHAVIHGARRLIADPCLKSVMIELMLRDNFHQPVIDTLVAAGFDRDADMEEAVRAKTTGVQYTGNILFTRR